MVLSSPETPATLLAPTPALAADRLVAAVTEVAERVLAPSAERTARDGVDRDRLAALAAVGAFDLEGYRPTGADGVTARQVRREIDEVLAAADGATWFVWAQHHPAIRALDRSDNTGLRQRWLPALRSGAAVAAFGGASPRNASPALTAVPTATGWRLDGALPWVTGWGTADVLLVTAVTAEDQVVAALLPRSDRIGQVSAQRLWCMDATGTVSVRVTGLEVAAADVVGVLDCRLWRLQDRYRRANCVPAVFGTLRAAVRELGRQAQRADAEYGELATALATEAADLRARVYQLLDEAAPGDRLAERVELRAAAIGLAVQAATAVTAATGARAMAQGGVAARLSQEAMFHLVFAQPAAVRTATAGRLLRGLTDPLS